MAGNVALDFVNTAEERGHPEAGDVLHTAADLRRWGERYGLITSATKPEPMELPRALEARELLYNVFFAMAHGRPLAVRDLEQLSGLAATAYGAGTLTRAADGTTTWRWPPTEISSVRHVVVTSAVELLGSDRVERLKQCPGEQCGWFFLDSTKRGNRRWCSMSECGQEAKTARRRSRRQLHSAGA